MVDDSVILTLAGASLADGTERDAEPTWQHRTVSVSQHTANNGSQWPEWIDGMRRASGFSENVTAWQPLAAIRCTSAIALSTSNRGKIPHGMNRSGYAPHQSSMCQSLY